MRFPNAKRWTEDISGEFSDMVSYLPKLDENGITLTNATINQVLTVTSNIKLEENGKIPTQGHKNDVGQDMYTSEDALIIPGLLESTMVPLGIHTQFQPERLGMMIVPRSSMSKMPLQLGNTMGIIEGTYTGEIMLALRNTFPTDFYKEVVVSDRVLVWNQEKKELVKEPIAGLVSEELMEKAYDAYQKTIELTSSNTDILKSLKKRYDSYLPIGTIFLPKGSRIVQAMFIPRFDVQWHEVEELKETERGNGGFGSTNTK